VYKCSIKADTLETYKEVDFTRQKKIENIFRMHQRELFTIFYLFILKGSVCSPLFNFSKLNYLQKTIVKLKIVKIYGHTMVKDWNFC
jgi:hypothetical protein